MGGLVYNVLKYTQNIVTAALACTAIVASLFACDEKNTEVLVGYGRGVSILRIYIDNGYIYYVDNPLVPTTTMASIFRIPVNGGEPQTIVSKQNMYFLAMDANYYYWANHGDYSGPRYPSAIMRMGRHGGEPEALYQDLLVRPYCIAISAEHVYWTEGQGPSKVLMQNKEGASFNVIATTRETTFLSVHDRYLYYSDVGDLWRMTVDGGSQELLIEGLVDIRNWKHFGDEIFLTDCGGSGCGWYVGPTGEIHKYTLSTGELVKIASGLDQLFSIAADEVFVYAGLHIKLGGSVIYLARDGGPVGVLADGLDAPNSIVVDDDYVYWSTLGLYDGSAIMRMPKPRSPP